MEKTNRIKTYIAGCLKSNNAVVELGYHENDAFIDDVVARYHDNISFINNEYTDVHAKDDAIQATLNFWNAKSMNR